MSWLVLATSVELGPYVNCPRGPRRLQPCSVTLHPSRLQSSTSHAQLTRSTRQVPRGSRHERRSPSVNAMASLTWVSLSSSGGAFSDVTPLPAGGAVLEATPRLPQYERNAVRRVFVALGPVLADKAPWPDQFDRFKLIYDTPPPRSTELECGRVADAHGSS
jgi:hypothetical protein